MSRRRRQRPVVGVEQATAGLDLTAEALRLVRSGRDANLQLRMLGSTAVAAKCEAAQDLLRRNHASPKDIDLAGLAHQRGRVRDFLYGHGLRRPTNGLQTPYMDRDVFVTKRAGGEMRVEIFFDEMRFIHPISFRRDFTRGFPTLPIEILLMSKLQMRLRSPRDWLHLAALLIQSAADDERGKFQPISITRQAESDYRCWRDFKSALGAVASPERLAEFGLTNGETTALNAGVELVNGAVGVARHGLRWALGRIKALLRIEPPEPEEFWED